MRRFVLVLLLLAAMSPAAAAAQEPEASVGADTAAYYFLVARRLEDAGKPDEAIATLQRALKLAPASAEIRAELAAVYARSDRVVEAVTAAEEAVKFDAANAEANRILAGWMTKPVNPNELLKVVQTAMVEADDSAKN